MTYGGSNVDQDKVKKESLAAVGLFIAAQLRSIHHSTAGAGAKVLVSWDSPPAAFIARGAIGISILTAAPLGSWAWINDWSWCRNHASAALAGLTCCAIAGAALSIALDSASATTRCAQIRGLIRRAG